MRLPSWLVGTFVALALLAFPPAAEACSLKFEPPAWAKPLGGNKRLVYDPQEAAIDLLKAMGGPLGGPLICQLAVPDVRVGVSVECDRRVPTRTQAEALQRALERT